MPSAAEYKRAFLAISPVPPSYLEILRYHYHRPGRTTSGAAIARAIGFKDWNPVSRLDSTGAAFTSRFSVQVKS